MRKRYKRRKKNEVFFCIQFALKQKRKGKTKETDTNQDTNHTEDRRVHSFIPTRSTRTGSAKQRRFMADMWGTNGELGKNMNTGDKMAYSRQTEDKRKMTNHLWKRKIERRFKDWKKCQREEP